MNAAGRLHQGLLVRGAERPVRRRPRGPARGEPEHLDARDARSRRTCTRSSLQVNLEAKAGDKVVWLLELQQAGAFLIQQPVGDRPRPGA
ncbi:MAG: hypothetical protein MZV64_20930 [Ignavibacteriales bacterium]|nr:hypothetical protein [Ignavibacteriales bacterium]